MAGRMKQEGKGALPVMIRGVVYEDARAAGRALGVSHRTINNLVARGRADHAGLGRGKHDQHHRSNAKPVKIGPLEFRSVSAAAKELGIDRSTLRRYLQGGADKSGALPQQSER